MEVDDGGSSMGPSSAAAVVVGSVRVSGTWARASHGCWGGERRRAETEEGRVVRGKEDRYGL